MTQEMTQEMIQEMIQEKRLLLNMFSESNNLFIIFIRKRL